MSQHAETKRHFRLAMVQGGVPVAPSAVHSRRWTREFEELVEVKFTASPRLVNSFKVGADPEFVFADLERGIRLDAESFGLKTGIAFGADMNGRLVELRPQASRFALDVLASILEELRWLAAYKPKAALYAWRAGAFLYKDGIGGHVHLGRKKGLKQVREWARHFNQSHGRRGEPHTEGLAPVKPEQLKRMDLIFYALTELGVYNKEQVKTRQQGDQHGQRYGMFGDVRMQAHGYEYRSYPSWLDHPLSAYLALVLTKLAAYDPEVLPNPEVLPTSNARCLQLVRNLLAYYKGRDDDAALAYAAITRMGTPIYVGDDFKERWGIGQMRAVIPAYVPDMIEGHEDTKRALYHYLMDGLAIPVDVPKVTWTGTIPSGYECLLGWIESTRGQKGIGELAFDLYCRASQPVRLYANNDRDWVVGTLLGVKPEGRKMLLKAGARIRKGGANMSVQIPPRWREPGMLAQTKAVLLALLPVWTAEQLQKSVPGPEVRTVPKAKRWVGKILV